jgi:hypothetical protein
MRLLQEKDRSVTCMAMAASMMARLVLEFILFSVTQVKKGHSIANVFGIAETQTHMGSHEPDGCYGIAVNQARTHHVLNQSGQVDMYLVYSRFIGQLDLYRAALDDGAVVINHFMFSE